jgi:glucose/arabinose dehydrogenase
MTRRTTTRRRFVTALGAGGALAAGAGLASGDGHREPLEDPIPEPIETGPREIRLETVATGLTAPNWGAAVPGCPRRRGQLVVTDQDGVLWAVNVVTGGKTVLLDASDRLVSLGVGGPGTFDERGLLGVAFHPEFADTGTLYTYTSEPVDADADFSTMPAGATPNHQSVLSEWRVPSPCDPGSVVDPGTRRELLRIDEPQFNHDAGALAFGPDGLLYVALGDGGAADDQGVGHVPGGNGQDPGNVLGTILRIDPDGSDAANGQYGVPDDNPFVGVAGALDEVYAYGFRNPFRIAFDAGGERQLFAGDAGQNLWEEVDIVTRGGNYGWHIREGSHCFDPESPNTSPAECPRQGPQGEPLIAPIVEYKNANAPGGVGLVVVGGAVYRGSALPEFQGRYIFGDWSTHVGKPNGLLLMATPPEAEGEGWALEELRVSTREDGRLGSFLLSFGQDADGELYVMTTDTPGAAGHTGKVYQVVP